MSDDGDADHGRINSLNQGSHSLNAISINFIEQHYHFDYHWSLPEHETNHFIRMPLNSGNAPQFRKSEEALKNGQFWRPKKWMWGPKKKAFPESI